MIIKDSFNSKLHIFHICHAPHRIVEDFSNMQPQFSECRNPVCACNSSKRSKAALKGHHCTCFLYLLRMVHATSAVHLLPHTVLMHVAVSAFHTLRVDMQQCKAILKLISKTKSSTRLIEGSSSFQPACFDLIQQPAVHQNVHGFVCVSTTTWVT